MKRTVELLVDDQAAGARLDDYLAGQLTSLSRMRIARLLAEAACAVNDCHAHAGWHVKAGDAVSVALSGEEEAGAMMPEALPLDVVYEDEQLLVVVKPAGMLVHPTKSVKSGTLANALAYRLNRARLQGAEVVRPGLVHRLDKATSGLMVIAKTQRALSILSRHFHQRLVEKKYLAVLTGRVVADELLLTQRIGRDENSWPKWRVADDGKAAETHLRVLDRRGPVTLAELEPRTGRTNQLRIHCAAIRHPIIGDDLYGGEPSVRLCLHAARLAFHHPAGGRWMAFSSSPPHGMREFFVDQAT